MSQCCPQGYQVPACPPCNYKTQTCQQLAPTNCSCSYNVCVNISKSGSSSGSGSSTLGGALGGILGALAVAVALFIFWRQKRNRAKIIQARVKADAKVRAAAAEKFRPGRATADGGAPINAAGTGVSANLGSGHKRPLSQGSSISRRSGPHTNTLGAAGSTMLAAVGPGSNGHGIAIDPFADPADHLDDEDTEWTELRPDGLTTFKKSNPTSPTSPSGGAHGDDAEEEEMLDGLGALVGARRHSTGAATHLSRITEGAEEDEDERRSLAPTVRSSFRLSTHAPPMPADAVNLVAQQAAATASLRSAAGALNRGGASSPSPQAMSLALPMGGLTASAPGDGGNLLSPGSFSGLQVPNSRRLSTQTTATGISMASSIGEVVTATTSEPIRRVQLTQDKPQLVRTLSGGRSEAGGEGSVRAQEGRDSYVQSRPMSSATLKPAHVDDEIDLESIREG
ncbi:hypothetical protein OC846_002871 [Tilletia horrida]|uniref:Membrane anchor Opy2 N-terminal domain-containing protein n=1 Tax=Tilletia horrida TaxID=155126 RepID=A0AAN6JYG6_9BASI|nr:hypothetical protein OC846_002871 [Tilletia horrida]